MRDAFSALRRPKVFADFAKRNMEMFEEAGRAFTASSQKKPPEKDTASEVEKLRAELAALQAKVDKFPPRGGGGRGSRGGPHPQPSIAGGGGSTCRRGIASGGVEGGEVSVAAAARSCEDYPISPNPLQVLFRTANHNMLWSASTQRKEVIRCLMVQQRGR